MHSSLSTPLASRRMSENFQQDNQIDRTPRSAMTLSRREMLEQWRASKRQRDANSHVILSENLPFNGRRGNLPPSRTPNKLCDLYPNVSTPTASNNFEERTTRAVGNHPTNTNTILEKDSEQLDAKEPENESEALVESKPDLVETTEAKAEAFDTVTTSVEAMNFNQQIDSTVLDSAVDQSDFSTDESNLVEKQQTELEPIMATIEPIAVEPIQEENNQSEGKEDAMSQITLDPLMDEYDVPLLLLANDTLVLQLTESEARRVAECSRLRQERDELRLELSMQDARFKVHVKRMEQAMQEGLMASLERIQELSDELESARALIESLQLKSGSSKRG